VQVPFYWLLVGLAVMFISPVLSIVVSVQVNQRTTARALQAKEEASATAEAAKEEANALALVRYCRLMAAQTDVYAEAETEVGKAAYRTWLTEYQTAGCMPYRQK
jgi:hypothetical protein